MQPSAGPEAAVPPDKAAVIAALRLGWTLAEFRGRNRPVPPHVAEPHVERDDNALPLRIERSTTEQAIETRMVLVTLAQQLGVDAPVPGGRGTKPQQFSAQAERAARTIHQQRSRGEGQLQGAWHTLTGLLYKWDAHIQDRFTATSEAQECAYQLGRGLAEAYWALEADNNDADEPASWTYLLSAERCHELTRLAGRVSAYLNPMTAPVVTRSLRQWATVAADAQTRSPDAATYLRQQMRHWYALLVLGQDPETFLRESKLAARWQLTLRALRLYAGELIVGALGAIAVAVVAALIATDTGGTVLKVALGLLAFFGITGATIQARLKTVTQALVTRLRERTYVDLVAEAATVLPPGAGQRLARTQ